VLESRAPGHEGEVGGNYVNGPGTAHLHDSASALLTAEHVEVTFPTGRRGSVVHAVSDVSIDLLAGETLSLVGESGCGKSTLGRALVRLVPLDGGRIVFAGTELSQLVGEQLRAMRPRLQIIFQDPVGSLNPRHRVGDLVAEPLRIWNRGTSAEQKALVDQMLREVGLDPSAVRDKLPHQLSGGQCQRVSIARALILHPDVLVCDEPVSSLDVSVQAQVLNLLQDLKELHRLTLVFISHDLAVVRSISDRIAVMYLGKLCEMAADLDDLYQRPAHPYTAMLLAAVPRADPDTTRPARIAAPEPPSPVNPPSGCRFRTRCERVQARCADEEPPMVHIGADRYVACHYPLIEKV
jgi:peptide/nickel transport system ATP-binding protein